MSRSFCCWSEQPHEPFSITSAVGNRREPQERAVEGLVILVAASVCWTWNPKAVDGSSFFTWRVSLQLLIWADGWVERGLWGWRILREWMECQQVPWRMLPVEYLPNDARTITQEVRAPLNERSTSRAEVVKKKWNPSCKWLFGYYIVRCDAIRIHQLSQIGTCSMVTHRTQLMGIVVCMWGVVEMFTSPGITEAGLPLNQSRTHSTC